jgi:tetratricopeptide (TPR) repeat protein
MRIVCECASANRFQRHLKTSWIAHEGARHALGYSNRERSRIRACPGASDFCPDPSSCASSDAERSILACSFVIDTGAAKPAEMAIAYYNSGNAYASLHRFDKAIEDYSQAVSLHPRFPGAYNNRANALPAVARYPEAIGDYSQVIALDANHIGAHYNRGVSFAKIGQLDRAIDDVTEAIKLDPRKCQSLLHARTLLPSHGGTSPRCF